MNNVAHNIYIELLSKTNLSQSIRIINKKEFVINRRFVENKHSKRTQSTYAVDPTYIFICTKWY